MKPLITGLALLIMFISLMLFESDNYNMRLQYLELKNTADQSSANAAVFYNDRLFSDKEIKIYKEEEGLKAIEKTVFLYMRLRGYKKIDKYIYFFNDNHICNVYLNEKKIDSFYFNYPYLYEDQNMRYSKLISEASIVVTLDAGDAYYHLQAIKPSRLIRSSGYEYIN